MTTLISFEDGERNLDWIGLSDAIAAGHALPKAEISDSFLYRGKDTLLVRQAWIDGLGVAVKAATVFPDNPTAGIPMIHGSVSLFDDDHGDLSAIVDFHLVTKWKTAADSLLGARRLARPDSEAILILGAGVVARSLYAAYSAAFPKAKFILWNRTSAKAAAMADELGNATVADDLERAVASADIITSATMSTDGVISGEWLRPGQHLDLIGAYRPDMREADDRAFERARVFVDSYDTTIGHIGEIIKPMESGALAREDIIASHYQPEAMRRGSEDEITLFKNGGGAHMDLMTSHYILQRFQAG